MIKTEICELFNIQYPIFQGGMAWAGTGKLAGSVSEAGGLGVIGAGNMPPDALKEEIRKAREITNKPFGVNIMLLSPFAKEIKDLIIKEKIPVVTTGAGNPGPFMREFKLHGIKVIPVVASVALAKRLEREGADALIAEGLESGGHIGTTTTMTLIPQIVDAVSIPVIAAGGIADGRGMVAVLALGACGVQMGTRFVVSVESEVHEDYKKAILKANDRSTIETGKSTGHPVRVLKNKLTRIFLKMEKEGASIEELEKIGTGALRRAVVEGDVAMGSVMAGQISGMIRDIKPVKKIMDDIIKEAEEVLKELNIKYLGG